MDELRAAKEAISLSDLEEKAKEFMLKALADLLTFLQEIRFYGFEAAWAKNAELVASRKRISVSKGIEGCPRTSLGKGS